MFSRSVLVEQTLINRLPPVNFDEKDVNLFSHEFVKNNPSIYLNKLRNIHVSTYGVMSLGFESLPKPLYSKQSLFKKKLDSPLLCLKSIVCESEELKEDVMWVVDCWSHNYFHWITDVLPRLEMIQNATSCKTLLLPKHLLRYDFVKASLRLFDIQKLIEISSDQLFKCRNLLVIDTEMVTGNYNKTSIKNVRKLCAAAYSSFCIKEELNERVYISRQKASKRKIINENELISTLSAYDFRLVYMEDYSFEEQLKLIMPAKYLISNHGAGMTNMMFMQPVGSVLELRREGDTHNNCYFSMSSVLSLKYYYQLCRSGSSTRSDNSGNIIVDVALFEKNIQLMLARA